jgi:hypothetical protein
MEAPTVVVFLVMAFAIVAHGLTQVLQAWMMPHAMYQVVKLYTHALQKFMVSDAWMMKNVENAKDFIMDAQLFLIITSKEFWSSICW